MRARVEAVADELIAELAAHDTAELMESYAIPLPLNVIGALLGLPVEDRGRVRDWMVSFFSEGTDEQKARNEAELAAYLDELIAAKRERPDDGMISALVATSDGTDQLSGGELVSMTYLLILAGFDTTVNLIGNGILALLTEPGRVDRLRADPALLPAAVEEILRYDGPLNTATTRFTNEPVTLGGTPIPAGEIVLVSLLSANRDEDRFPGSDEFDLDREANPHLAFGHGIHYCLGAPLARLEGEIALGRLLKAFPALALDTGGADPTYRVSVLMRGLTALPVRLK